MAKEKPLPWLNPKAKGNTAKDRRGTAPTPPKAQDTLCSVCRVREADGLYKGLLYCRGHMPKEGR